MYVCRLPPSEARMHACRPSINLPILTPFKMVV